METDTETHSADSRVTLTLAGRTIILIGTAHVSKESIAEVNAAINAERPALVCVELDQARYQSIAQKDNWERLDVVKVFREKKGFLLMANLVLASFQRRMGSGLGVNPGEEMKAAIEAAEERGIPWRLCDRDIQATLRRAWGRCGFWSKAKLLSALFSSAFSTERLSEDEIEHLKTRGELDGMMDALAQYLPKVKETLIDERDRYLAAKIWDASDAAGGGATLAVVGAGHLPGLSARLEAIASGAEDTGVSALEEIPRPGVFSRIAGWAVPAAIVAFIAAGFFLKGTDVSLEMLVKWLVCNSSLAALGCLAALGHPLSILAAFFGAPIATLNPFIGVGIFSGIVEATLRKPRVEDAETLAQDIGSLRGIYKNRITRALLVFFLSSIGGAIGNFVALPSFIGGLLGK
ncbi:MAG: TraB/GumN family protein [Treponema sp.]|jgi:pheromone shutdown-related protein TraB|nr:TraB/GumN family protein [Treponema sp.]